MTASDPGRKTGGVGSPRAATNDLTEVEEEKIMTTYVEEIELNVEELEAVIAPGITTNHNETLEVDLCVEGLEAVIAPGFARNHNETLVSDAVR